MSKNRNLFCKFILIIAMLISGLGLLKAQMGLIGHGTATEPYQIQNATHLNQVRYYLGSYFVQTSDIDLSDFLDEQGDGYNDGALWLPIGDATTPFTGNYDGGGFAIINLAINRGTTENVGFWGYTSGATITNLAITGADITGNNYSAVLAGRIVNTTITNCSASGNLEGVRYVGGISGHQNGGTISGTHADVDITATSHDVGGLVGNQYGSSSYIQNCYATGDVYSPNGNYIGGFVGYQRTETSSYRIENSYATGNVTGNSIVGGLVGYQYQSRLRNTYASGAVTGNSSVGGLVGNQYSNNSSYRAYIEYSYAVGWVNGTSNVGGLIGSRSGGYIYVTNSYWNRESTGQTTSADGESRTTAEMTYPYSNNSYVGWDFSTVWATDTNYDINDGYPYLRVIIDPAEIFAYGSGTEADPWQIETAEHLNNVRNYLGETHSDKHFVQTANIDLTAIANWEPIGTATSRFTGCYDGGEFTISNLTINRPSTANVGLFGYADGAVLENIELLNVNITGRNYTGGIVGQLNGQLFISESLLSNSSVSGLIVGDHYVGGLVGYMNISQIEDSYSIGTVNGRGYVGGLVGYKTYFESTISGSYSTAAVNGTTTTGYVGGLVGYNNHGDIIESYFTGTVLNGSNYSGGIIGYLDRGNVIKSYSIGDIQGLQYVGGLVGYQNQDSEITESYAAAIVEGYEFVGGLVGNKQNSTAHINDSYATASVTGTFRYVGGIIGYNNNGDVTNCYSSGTVIGTTNNIGGFIGAHNSGTIANSYWNTETSTQIISAGGFGRTTDEMVFEYDANTYVDWDFETVWNGSINSNYGFPYLEWQTQQLIPAVSMFPQPNHNETGIHRELSELVWYYNEDTLFTNPVGFRVYFNDTGVFGEEEGFVWTPYIEEQERYATSEILLDMLDYGIRYYWQVIPSTKENGTGEGKDARNCSIWSFVTQRDPSPRIASNPIPADNSDNISVDLEQIGWDYIANPSYTNPVGFRVYFADTLELGEEYWWVDYISSQENYSLAVPIELERDKSYFWKVVPTTIYGSAGSQVLSGSNRRIAQKEKRSTIALRNDADNVPVWRFHTEYEGEGVINPPEEPTESYIADMGGIQIVFIPNAGESQITSINVVVSSNPNLNAIQRFSNPGALGRYFRFAIPNSGVFIRGAYLQLEFATKPNQIWLSIGEGDWVRINDELIDWTNPLKPIISLSGLFEGGFRADIFEFAGDSGGESITLPVQLSSFTASVLANGIVELKWVSETESNMLGYNVFRNNENKLSNAFLATMSVIPANNTSVATEYKFIDEDVFSGNHYYYWLQSVDYDLSSEFFGPLSVVIENEEEVIPVVYETALRKNYPNPFNPETTISFSIKEDTNAELAIYNIKGQVVRTLHSGLIKAGEHKVIWNGTDDNNKLVGSGIYFYRLTTSNYDQINKMLLVK